MRALTKATAGAVFAGSLLLTGGIAPAAATHNDTHQDGLVNVAVGDVTILEDVNVAVGASAAVTVCDAADVVVNQVAVLARAIAVDRSGRSATICSTDAGNVVISQN